MHPISGCVAKGAFRHVFFADGVGTQRPLSEGETAGHEKQPEADAEDDPVGGGPLAHAALAFVG